MTVAYSAQIVRLRLILKSYWVETATNQNPTFLIDFYSHHKRILHRFDAVYVRPWRTAHINNNRNPISVSPKQFVIGV